MAKGKAALATVKKAATRTIAAVKRLPVVGRVAAVAIAAVSDVLSVGVTFVTRDVLPIPRAATGLGGIAISLVATAYRHRAAIAAWLKPGATAKAAASFTKKHPAVAAGGASAPRTDCSSPAESRLDGCNLTLPATVSSGGVSIAALWVGAEGAIIGVQAAGKVASQAGRDMNAATEEVRSSSARVLASLRWNPVARGIETAGRSDYVGGTANGMLPVAIGLTFVQYSQGGDSFWKAAAKTAVTTGVAFLGAQLGALAGAAIGTPTDVVDGPVGTIGGALLGSIAGGAAGGFVGNALATQIFGP